MTVRKFDLRTLAWKKVKISGLFYFVAKGEFGFWVAKREIKGVTYGINKGYN